MSPEELLDSTFARAYKEAEGRKAEAEEARRAAEVAAAATAPARVYDPRFYPDSEPHDPALYEATGIGALYGMPGSERFLELGDWTLGEEQPA